ncbi:MAG: hypothetical protein QXZ60_04660 [Sulfolobales archaeon]
MYSEKSSMLFEGDYTSRLGAMLEPQWWDAEVFECADIGEVFGEA